MKIRFALLAVGCLLTSPAVAQSSSDDNMSSFPCGVTDHPMLEIFCGAYAMGYLHAVQALKPPRICFPPDLSAEEASQVLKRWAETHPARSKDELAKRPLDAFASEWPCR